MKEGKEYEYADIQLDKLKKKNSMMKKRTLGKNRFNNLQAMDNNFIDDLHEMYKTPPEPAIHKNKT